MDPVAVLGDGFLLDPADLGVVDDFCPGLPNVGPFPDVGGDLLLNSDLLDLGEVELLVTLVLGDGGDFVVSLLCWTLGRLNSLLLWYLVESSWFESV